MQNKRNIIPNSDASETCSYLEKGLEKEKEYENKVLKIHAEKKSKPPNWLVSNCERRKRKNRNALVE